MRICTDNNGNINEIMLNEIVFIFKKGGIVDREHAGISSEYAASILEKFNLPVLIKDRIINIVENHHLFKAYNT